MKNTWKSPDTGMLYKVVNGILKPLKEEKFYCPPGRVKTFILKLKRVFTIKVQWCSVHNGVARYLFLGEHPYTWFKVLLDIKVNTDRKDAETH